MNKKNKYLRKRGGGNYGSGHIHHLLIGHDYFNDGFGTDAEAMRAAWPELRDDVFKHMVERHKQGLTNPLMPWGFWELESLQSRDRSLREPEQLQRMIDEGLILEAELPETTLKILTA